ncbi:TRAP transporter substrate-binding protein DctP [Clostridium sp. OM02-18AC]|uniref:DctP family TRAP transporter solute-binding subunit n=1 Tax=Clostridium sp. OM02-18AC TaxID=2292311 RepID=UPI000E4C6EA1|nr:DctP family TRAP transporter solute-binding subunit [Clostridium sp. OM02-18AC]RHV66557.1 TRAP transporter substrate-binding protein DctP [Clostridium sp. OM02-18AC]
MKKGLAVFTATAMAFALTACGGSGNQTASTTAAESKTADSSAAAPATNEDVLAADVNLDNPSTQGSEVTLSLNHVGSTTHPYQYGVGKFAQLANAYTDGAVGVTIYPASQIASGAKAVEAVQLGTLDMCLESTMALENFVPEIGVLNLPFIFSDKNEAYTVLDGDYGEELKQYAESQGFKVLCWMDNGFRDISNNVRPITSPDDMKGLKMRTPESSVFIDTFEQLGATATAMATSELFSAMQLGTVDGQENATSTFVNNKYYEVNKYYSITHHIYTAEPLIISLDKWNSLSDDQKTAIQKAADEACAYQREVSDSQAADLLQQVKDNGCEVNELTLEATEAFKQAVEPIYTKYEANYGELIQKVRDAVAAVK